MSRLNISLLLLSTLLVSLASAAVDETDTQPTKLKERGAVRFGDSSQPRTARLFGNLLEVLLSPPRYNYYDYGGEVVCPPNSCPDWRCQDDSAVIHGYCCGCARRSGIFNIFDNNRVTRGPHKKFYCPSRGCPNWSCQDDSSVIHGYCCGCAHPDDNVPFVTCRPDLRCPISAEPLCTDYNFMMDCCCTGP